MFKHGLGHFSFETHIDKYELFPIFDLVWKFNEIIFGHADSFDLSFFFYSEAKLLQVNSKLTKVF